MTTTATPTSPTSQPVASAPGSPEGSGPARTEPAPRRVSMPPLPLLARFSEPAAQAVAHWQGAHSAATLAWQHVDDARPGGLDYRARINATVVAARKALGEGVALPADQEGLLAVWLRDELPARVARAVVATAEADELLERLLAQVRCDTALRTAVDAAVESWVASSVRRLDADEPGAQAQVDAEIVTRWRPLAGLLSWVHSPVAGYRARTAGRCDARVVEARVMSAIRRGVPVPELPYGGSARNGERVDDYALGDRYDLHSGAVLRSLPEPGRRTVTGRADVDLRHAPLGVGAD